MKELVDSFGAINALAKIALTGKISYSVSKAFKKVKGEIETYNEGELK